ncbi:MAG TPA: S8 family serine peptidase [Streptosporangiaceae bacterium]|nr:S8 family serine peptidase [Streptosporangiaceae bacterium]
MQHHIRVVGRRRGRGVAVLGVFTLLAVALVAPPRPANAADGGDRQVIIELDAPPVTAAPSAAAGAARTKQEIAQARSRAAAAQRDVADRAAAADIRLGKRRSITDLVNAIAATVPAADVARLARLPGVRAVHPDRLVRASTDVSAPLIGAPDVWKRTDDQGRPAKGAGVTVAVVDTGVDYTNPSLGGGFGPGHRVVAGNDFVNGDNDPADDNGHGTHVAGIVAGNGPVTGVAPDATITAYKVLDRRGAGLESNVIAALQEAADPANPYRADVVNMSLGIAGDGTDPLGRAATAATEAGVVVVGSAGNSGPATQSVGTPAAADGVIAVGASTSGVRIPAATMVAPVRQRLQTFRAPHSANPPADPLTGDLVDVGAGNPADYDRVGDVRGKVVAYRAALPTNLADVSPRLIEQARLAEDRGAIGLLAYVTGGGPVVGTGADPAEGLAQDPAATAATAATANSAEPGVADVPLRAAASGDSFRMDRIIVLGMDALQWQEIARHLANGKVSIRLSGEDITDNLAAFSSRGPTSRFTLKPDIAAPGVEIRSAWPRAQWGPGVYRLSGTSMAAPHVAGAAALVRQLHPAASGAWVRAALIGSAKGLAGTGPTDQGAGRLSVDAAARATVTAAPSTLSLGLADLSRPTISATGKVTLRNDGSTAVDVTLRAERAPNSPGTATPSTKDARIPAGGSVEVALTVSAPRPAQNADVSGWIVADVRADGAPDVRVPYLLAARPLTVQTSPDPSDGTGDVFVHGPTALARPPVVQVIPPSGPATTVRTTPDHDTWYRAAITGRKPGVYRLVASATAQTGQRLVGTTTWEVAAERAGRAAWTPVGPNSQAGFIATTPADPAVAVINQQGKAGPWLSRDHGRTWTQRNHLPIAGGSGRAIIDARHPNRMWYAVNGTTKGIPPTTFDPTYQGKILRSDDYGRTWRTLDTPDLSMTAFVSDKNTHALVAVTTDGLLVSRDAGDSWTTYPTDLGADVVTAAFGGPDLFLSTRTGVWALRGFVNGPPSRIDRVYDAGTGRLDTMVADDELVAILDEKDRVRGSRDGGATWQDLVVSPGLLSLALHDGVFMGITFKPDNLISRDHGRTWTAYPAPINGASEFDVVPWGGDSLLFASSQAGLFRTTAGAPAQRIGVPGMTVYSLVATADSTGRPMLLAGTDSDAYRTALPAGDVTPGTSEWGLTGSEAHIGTRIGQLAVSPSQPGTLWKIRKAATSTFYFYRSTDGGATWTGRGTGAETAFDLVVGPTDPDRVVVPSWSLNGAGLYVTRDGGATWKKLFHKENFTTVAADPADPDRLWLGSAKGLYRSDDFGTTVTQVLSGPVTAISVTGRRVIAGGETLRWSDDGGRTFRDADSGALQMKVSRIVVSPVEPNTVYAATTTHVANGLIKGGRGVLRSTDGGRTWENISAGLENLAVESLTISQDGRALFAGTVNGGVHRLDLPDR